MFHPDGLVYQASTEPCASEPALSSLGERIAGTTLVRLSSALWRAGNEWPDVLGIALRFRWSAPPVQDLLLASIRFPWTMPFAPLATNFHSFLWNHYHAVSPFEVPGVGRAKLRLRSPRLGNSTPLLTRAEHLERAVRGGRARFVLELRRLEPPPLARRWEPVASLSLTAPFDADQDALRFSAFNDGAGLRPVGFVHAIRVGAYEASQAARPASDAR
jgi:hypothetical protein